MAFNGKTASTRDAEEYKASILEEINEFGVKLSEIKAVFDEESKKKSDIENVTKKLEDLEIKMSEKEKEYSDQKIKNQDLEARNTFLINAMGAKEEVYKKLEDAKTETENAKSELTSVNNQCGVANRELGDIKTEIENTKITLESIKKDYDLKIQNLDTNFNSKKEQLDKEIEDLVTKKQSIVSSLDEQSKEVSKSKDELIKINSDIESANTTLDNLKKDYNEKKISLDKELADKSAIIDAKAVEITRREGDIALKEALIIKNTTNLRTIKTQLEQKLGSSINIDL